MPEMDQKKQNLLRVYTRMAIKESIVQNFCLNNLKPDELCGTIGYSYVKGVCTMIFDQFTPQMLDFLAENHIRNSITDGSGIDMAEVNGYPAQMQQILGEDYYVKNFGVGARTMLNKVCSKRCSHFGSRYR